MPTPQRLLVSTWGSLLACLRGKHAQLIHIWESISLYQKHGGDLEPDCVGLMASDETITKMRYIDAMWNREGTPHLQKCLCALGLKGSWQVVEVEDVKRRYLNLVKEIHPDKTRDTLSNTVFPIVKKAFEDLKEALEQLKKPTVPTVVP
jgi:hypothetical protein